MQLHFEQQQVAEIREEARRTGLRAIEDDSFPFEKLSRIAERESWRKEIYRPIYHIHKWWAQRLGSVFRGILLGALTPTGTDVLELFYSPVRFSDTVVFDPFMGSGTTLGETLKLGGRAIGRDINPVSYLQVRTALTLKDTKTLEEVYREIEADVADTIGSYYTTRLPDGTLCPVLYYFWVMQAPCPVCSVPVDLFSNYIFARHAYPARNPRVQVVCPRCSTPSSQDYRVRLTECPDCGHGFDAVSGPVKSKTAKCIRCSCEFTVGRAIRETGCSPTYRMYAKLVLTPNGKKEYLGITEYDEVLYQKAVNDLKEGCYAIPEATIEPGYNTNQVLNYGFRAWRDMFNARQLLCISTLANRIKSIDDSSLRDSFACLFSGVLEFNNMLASYKGEGTGAVRHMFYHHILKPERTPLEANIWGTPKSSGAFSTLFRSRLVRASKYARQPFELALSDNPPHQSTKVDRINEPLTGITNGESYDHFSKGTRLYTSCGDSAATDLPDKSVDVVVTDPPFFDNVHYSQLADFFYAWQRVIIDKSPSHSADSTRSMREVQHSDAGTFTERLTRVLRETERVLKRDGLLVFTYHHSRFEGWQSVLSAVVNAGFRIVACHPIKAEMSLAVPKHQSKSPINFDIIMVCRKRHERVDVGDSVEGMTLAKALDKGENQIGRLRRDGWKLSRNDIGVVIMANVVAGISGNPEEDGIESLFEESRGPLVQAIDHLYAGYSKRVEESEATK